MDNRNLKFALIASVVLTLMSWLVFSSFRSDYIEFQVRDEIISAKWSEVVSQYQRRVDLTPNLVRVVEKYAAHEEEIASRITGVQTALNGIPVETKDAASAQQFQDAQEKLHLALTNLVAVGSAFSQLKGDMVFIGLQTQLEGTENRITVARNRHIKAIEANNAFVRSHPFSAYLFGISVKPQFTVGNVGEISTAPSVSF